MTTTSRLAPWACLVALALVGSCAPEDGSQGEEAPPPIDASLYPLDDRIRMNHVQMKGTHNSFHVAPPDTREIEYQYTHAPLDVQLEAQGVRALEIDVRLNTSEDGTFDVSHIPVIDGGTTCKKLVECLTVVDRWSRAHPAHHPLFIQIDFKDLAAPEQADDYVLEMEKEIRSVLGRGRLVTPDDVRGDAATLRDAIRTRGWPTLRASRGKIVLYAFNPIFVPAYVAGAPSLEGRAMFLDGAADAPFAAIALRDDPRAADVPDLVRGGLIVRTRADAEGVEPRASDRTRLDAALASGAQIIATDYPVKVDGIDFVATIPDGSPSRCTPGVAPAECTPRAVEDPAVLASTRR